MYALFRRTCALSRQFSQYFARFERVSNSFPQISQVCVNIFSPSRFYDIFILSDFGVKVKHNFSAICTDEIVEITAHFTKFKRMKKTSEIILDFINKVIYNIDTAKAKTQGNLLKKINRQNEQK